MSLRCNGAILSSSPAEHAELLAELRRCRPELQWQVFANPAQAMFELCGGEYAVAVVDVEGVADDVEMMLRPVRRCAPATRLVVHARSPAHATLRGLAARRWLTCVTTDALARTLA